MLQAIGNTISLICHGHYEKEAKAVFDETIAIHSSFKLLKVSKPSIMSRVQDHDVMVVLSV